MAWQKMSFFNDGQMQEPVWYNTETGESSQYDPTPSGQYQMSGSFNDGSYTPQVVDAATGRPVTGEEAQRAEQQMAQQKEAEFMKLWNDPNASSFDKARAVHLNYGIETLAQLSKQGHFADVPQLGDYIAARQREANDAGFTVGGNKLGLWPVALGTAAFAGLASGAAGAESAAGGATTGGGAAAPAGVTYGTAAGDAATIYGTGAATGGGSAGLAGTAAGTGAAAGLEGAGAGGTSGATGATGATGGGAAGATTGVAAGGGAATTGASLLSNPQLLGAGLGAGLSLLGNNSKQAGTTTTEEGIPDWLMPYVQPALQKYSTELQNYQTDPYGIMPGAMQEFKNTIGGMYLDPSTNKYLEDYFKLGAERIKGSLSPSFGHMQAFGQHSGYNEALSRGLGDYAVGLYGGNYAQERDRQTQMTAAAPAFLGQSSQAAFQPYSQYLQSIGSLGKKKEEPFYNNQFGNILGGAMFGSQFGKAFS